MQQIARATYREILERRAKANGVDFIEGVATAITPIAFFETIMVKSYETLVDSDTKVDVNTGMVAAGRLQAVIDSRDYSRDLLVMKVQVGNISEAVRSVVPESMWAAIVEKLEELEQHSEALDVGTDCVDDDDDDRLRPDRVHRRGRRVLNLRSAPSPRSMGTAVLNLTVGELPAKAAVGHPLARAPLLSLDPEFFGEVLKRHQRNGVVFAEQRRLAHLGPDGPTVYVHEFHDVFSSFADSRDHAVLTGQVEKNLAGGQ